ncbi:MAG TPA: hypothetical protein VHW69_13120, partial [Rhizomicrobium sp.]|nr:hypothetical protein [Rhizomicrobium sp.]
MRSLISISAASTALAIFASASAHAATLTVFDPPGSTVTYVRAINDAGTLVGSYGDGYTAKAFLRAADGTITTFAVDNAPITDALAIDKDGRVCGDWTSHNRNHDHGYVREPDGTMTLFDPPHARQTTAAGLDAGADIVGSYAGQVVESSGFIRSAKGNFTTFNFPGAAATSATGINRTGLVTGDY